MKVASGSDGIGIMTIVGLAAVFLVLGLTQVWLNIERVDLAYETRKLQTELVQKQGHAAKLEVERDSLAAPHRLREVAASRKMSPATHDKVRRLEQELQQ